MRIFTQIGIIYAILRLYLRCAKYGVCIQNRKEATMKNLLVLFLGVALLAISSCTQKVDIEAERAMVQSVLDQVVQANEAEDMELMTKITAHDNDIVQFGSGVTQRFVGWEAFREAMQKQFELVEDMKISVRDRVIKVHSSGSVAWFSEIYDLNFVMQDEPGSLKGVRYTGVMESRDGNWMIVQGHLSVPVQEEAD